MAGAAPTGTATVVLGDVAGSTRLRQEHPQAMPGVSRRVAQLLDELAEANGGHRPREQGEGDNFVRRPEVNLVELTVQGTNDAEELHGRIRWFDRFGFTTVQPEGPVMSGDAVNRQEMRCLPGR